MAESWHRTGYRSSASGLQKMKVDWIITREDEERYREFVARYERHSFVRDRFVRNISRSSVDISMEAVWPPLVGCLLTSQQRSGARSRVSRFINEKGQLFSFAFCRDADCLEAIAKAVLTTAGVRFPQKLSRQINDAIEVLKTSSSQELQTKLGRLNGNTDPKREREVAQWIQRQLNGFGPKQARNLLQWVGLSQYEIPLDSRVMKVLRTLGFPVPLSREALSDEDYYCFVEDGLQTILSRIPVVPCIFDACAFASFESEAELNKG
jgi:thermostable 8-oxoguanine DNA glycosylase